MNVNWPERALKRHLIRNEGGVWGDDPSGTDDSIVLRSTDQTRDGQWLLTNPAVRSLPPSERNRCRLHHGDIVVTKSSGSPSHIGKATIVDHDVASLDASYSNFMQRLRTDADLRSRFLWYSMRSGFMRDQIELMSTTTTGLANLTGTTIGNLLVPVPTLPTQDAIITFLDRETAEIDAFIADQEELIGLLTERRAATISHAVTKGLDPTAPMKDSRIAWLGDIPTHWKVARISRLFSVTLGKMVDAGREVAATSVHSPYLRAANIRPGWLSFESVYEMPFLPAELKALDLRAGDLLVVEGGATVGMNAVVEIDMAGWSFQKTVNRLRARGQASTRYLSGYMDFLRERGVIEMISAASTFQHLTAEKLERVLMPVPPEAEQAAIDAFLRVEANELDSAIADAGEAIALSRERRAALISAAVTGKIDVREHGVNEHRVVA